ncbi:hypothetical protein EHS13_26140 [Paenibacillus psychroresistens]|uniref:SLH domain-containing protein n=1 Tax=Paenibacillus psychroresistens TaxID=1778678 RepID=A0A6B8RQJ5_9BACL|nr:S-layer homology domain-containing protein [Paenibacillus psychroresistens]QGQ98117.1 hypothetical protein EHS13_26140 [Paenibacillus psychroresistens]
MKNKFIKLIVSKLLIACLVFSSVGMAFAATAATTTDIKGHWAEPQITSWIEKGFIKGYEDNSFKPNNSITRAEFVALVNRSFAFTEQATISFKDVKASNWAYIEIAKGVKAGYIKGYADGTIGASKTISRQEVAVIVDRLLDLSAAASPSAFKDGSKIGTWAIDAVDSAVAAGILKGYAEDNTFKPANPITRAEAVVTLDRAIAPSNVVYNTAGTYGPATGNEVVNKDVVINTTGVILQNMTLNGKLTFASGIAQGDATLKNVTVKGDTTVQGGGVNSIHLADSVLATIIVDKDPSQGAVRIVAEGTTTVGQVNVNSPVTLQETNLTGTGFGNVTLTDKLPAGSEVILKGSFDSVVVLADGIKLSLAEGSIKSLTVSATATGTTLDVAAGTTITALNLDAVTTVTGKGTITMATLSAAVNATGLQKFETAPGTIVVGTATPVPTATPTPGNGGGDPGNGGGGCTSNCGTTPQNGTVTGFVYDSNDTAQSGAVVSATITGATYYSATTGNDGSFLISGIPVGSISSLTVTQNAYQSVTYNTYSVAAGTNTPIGIVRLIPNMTLAAASVTSNTYLDITVNQGVYGTSAHNSPVTVNSFKLTLSDGTASIPIIQSVTKVDGTPLAVTGGDTTIRVYFTVTGTPGNAQKLTVTPSSSTSIYNSSGSPTSVKETLITNIVPSN